MNPSHPDSLTAVLTERERFAPDPDALMADVHAVITTRRRRRNVFAVVAAGIAAAALVVVTVVAVRGNSDHGRGVGPAHGQDPSTSATPDSSGLLPLPVSPITAEGIPDGFTLARWMVYYTDGTKISVQFAAEGRTFGMWLTETEPEFPTEVGTPTTVQGRPAQQYTMADEDPQSVTTRLIWQQPSGVWVELVAQRRSATPEELHEIAESVTDEEMPIPSALAIEDVPAGYQLENFGATYETGSNVESATFAGGEGLSEFLFVTLNTGTIPDVYSTVHPTSEASPLGTPMDVPMGLTQQVDGVPVRISADGFTVARQVDSDTWVEATSVSLDQSYLVAVVAAAGER